MGEKYSTLHFVEDSDDEIFLSRILFEKQHVETEIVHSTNLEQLLAKLKQKTDDDIAHSLVVVDMNLPEMRGTEIIKRLREIRRYETMTIGICSGSEDPADVNAGLENGADFFVAKPLNKSSIQKICNSVAGLELIETSDNHFNLKHTY